MEIIILGMQVVIIYLCGSDKSELKWPLYWGTCLII